MKKLRNIKKKYEILRKSKENVRFFNGFVEIWMKKLRFA